MFSQNIYLCILYSVFAEYHSLLKLRHYEKATILEKNLPLVLTKQLFLLSSVKISGRFFQFFLGFLEKLNFTCKDHGTHQLRFCFDFHRWRWLLLLFCCCSNGCIRNGSVIQIITVNRFNGEWFVFVGSLVCTLKK